MDNEKFKILGEELAENIIEKFGTQSILQVCLLANIRIHYEKWNPVTLGEFDRKNNTICINLNANIDQIQIIAHEMGHYFIHQKGIKLNRNEEEIVVNFFSKLFSK